jgi:twitching motility two-component system response regulator PilH
MSETSTMPPLTEAPAKRTPTVYFIDDSATMREVIKIAFRRESINIITCADAASALGQFEQNPPDVVITDVIMPDQDGYTVCSQIKQNPQLSKTPVILMSGVVNKGVADRAVSVQADELVRKPFQPQDLIGRVKVLLGQGAPAAPGATSSDKPAGAALSNLFAPPPVPMAPPPARVTPMPPPAAQFASQVPVPPLAESRPADSAWPRALADAFSQQSAATTPNAAAPSAPRANLSPVDVQKLRGEIARLELLVKKLQTELQIERQYNQALEQHAKSLTQLD